MAKSWVSNSRIDNLLTFMCLLFTQPVTKSGSRTAATPKSESFMIMVNGKKPLTIITKRSILNVAAFLHPPPCQHWVSRCSSFGMVTWISLVLLFYILLFMQEFLLISFFIIILDLFLTSTWSKERIEINNSCGRFIFQQWIA